MNDQTLLNFLYEMIEDLESRLEDSGNSASDGFRLYLKGNIRAYKNTIRFLNEVYSTQEIPQFEGTREQLDGLSVKR